MRTLWHRAAQTRSSCNCTLCHSSAPALSRRTTSANVKRRIRFSDVFTLFYSSILASAAIADVGWKEARTKKWQKLIEEARNDLKALEDQQQKRLAAVSTLEDIAVPGPEPEKDTWHKTFAWAAKEQDRRKALGFQDLKGPSLCLLEGLSTSEIEDLIFDKYIARLNSKDGKHLWVTTDTRQKLSIKKIKTLEWSIRKLVHRLILSCLEREELPRRDGGNLELKSRTRQEFAGMDSDQLKTKLQQCTQRLGFLARHSSNTEYWYRFESPKAPTYSCWSNVRPERADSLNTKLYSIFNFARSYNTGKDPLVASICFELLTSYVPPDVHTYNLLIIRLTRLKQMADVEAVIASMYECHIRPNEVTLCLLLRYYTVTNNSIAFLRLLGKMEGHLGGLSVAHAATEIKTAFADRFQPHSKSQKKPTPISEEEEDYYYELEGYRFRPKGYQSLAECHETRKVVETARMMIMDRATYGALIHAALKFLDPSRAMAFYRQMLADGWEAGKRELGGILRHCCEKLEWHGALAVWQEICKLPRGAHKTALRQMLHLCSRRRKHVEFGDLLDYGVRQHLIPSTVWSFLTSGGDICSILDSADVQMSAKQLTCPITALERKLEFLGYRIARTALNLAEIRFSVPTNFDGTELKLCLRIMELHQNSPARSTYTARSVALQGLQGQVTRFSKIQNERSEYKEDFKRFPLTCIYCEAEYSNALGLHNHLKECSPTGAVTEDTMSSLPSKTRLDSQSILSAEEFPMHSQALPAWSQQADIMNGYGLDATVGLPENKEPAYNQGLQSSSSRDIMSTSVAYEQAPHMLESQQALGSRHENGPLDVDVEMTSRDIMALSEIAFVDPQAHATDFEDLISSSEMAAEANIPFYSDSYSEESLAIQSPSPSISPITELEQLIMTTESSDQTSDPDQMFPAHSGTSISKRVLEYLEQRPSELPVTFFQDLTTAEQPQAYSTMASSPDEDTPRDERTFIRHVKARAPIVPLPRDTGSYIRRYHVPFRRNELRRSESMRPPVDATSYQ